MYKDILCPCCGLRLKEGAESCSRCGLTGLNQIFLDSESYQRWKMEVLIPHKRAWEAKLAEERRREEERRRAAQRKTAQQRVKRRKRLIFKDDNRLLILMENGSLYGMGDNRDGSLGDVGAVWINDPILLSKNVRSAAASPHYSIYVTENGHVHLVGNGEYVDRFPGFVNAQEVLTREDAFFIRFSKRKWYGFGDNEDEGITKRTSKTICQFQDIPYKYTLDVGTSRGPMNHDERERFRGNVLPICEFVRATDEYRKLCEKYGGANIRVANVKKQPTKGWGEGYSYSEEGVGSAEVVLENRHIYVPVETKPRSNSMVDTGIGYFGNAEIGTDIGYFGGNFARDPGFWWEKESGNVFLAMQDEEPGFKPKERRLIATGVKEMFTVRTCTRDVEFEIILFMDDGRLLYGDVDAFSQTWNLRSLKVFKP